MERIDCHSSTPKSEVIAFLEKMKGKAIVLHFEGNMYPTWGDDYMEHIVLDEAGMKTAQEIVEKHYIHGAWEKNILPENQ